MPPNGRSVVRKRRRSHGSMTAEKTPQTLQNTVRALPDQWIIFLGRTFSGPKHDYRMLQHAWSPEWDGFVGLNVRVDRGDRGIQSDDRGEQIASPTRKPRTSQKPPTPPWSEEQKAANTALSRVR